MDHDLAAPNLDGHTSLRTRQAVTSALIAMPAIGGLSFLSFAGSPDGRIHTAGALAAVGFGATRAAMLKRSIRAAATAIVCLVLALVGVRIADIAPATTATLDASIDQFEQAGWQLEHNAQGGNLLCFDECRYATRTYRADQPLRSVLDDLEPRLTSAGFTNGAMVDSYGRYSGELSGWRYLITVHEADRSSTMITLSVRL